MVTQGRLCLVLLLILSFGFLQSSSANETEETLRKLTADIEALVQSNAALQTRMGAMAAEIDKLRDELERVTRKSASHEDLTKLSKTISELDKKRIEDRETILKEIAELGKLITKGNDLSATVPKFEPKQETKLKGQEYYTWTVKPGNSLTSILEMFNAEFKSNRMKTISMAQLIEANPGINPESIKPGREIFIPKPR